MKEYTFRADVRRRADVLALAGIVLAAHSALHPANRALSGGSRVDPEVGKARVTTSLSGCTHNTFN